MTPSSTIFETSEHVHLFLLNRKSNVSMQLEVSWSKLQVINCYFVSQNIVLRFV